MTTIAAGMRYVDVGFRQRPQIIATAVLDSPAGVALVDPGPTSCLPTLRAGLRAGGVEVADIRTILLTHIHLDHAGATGTLVQENPAIRVFVHEIGAPHLIDPARLLASARRLYGDAMDDLWGPFLPVPAANVTAVAGGERIGVAGRALDVAYTPGHASHHVSYFDASTGVAFIGDMGGVHVPRTPYILQPTPPPDINVESWVESTQRILAWHPATLFLTHFGTIDTPVSHLQQVLDNLHRNAALAKDALALDAGISDEERAAHFIRALGRDLRRVMSEADAMRYEIATPLDQNWQGLARYWRKRGQ
jgi:glyoxylase-like metal-dependent hydrolase (beta-lactamase superfamily II)